MPSSAYFKQVTDRVISDLDGFKFYATLEALGITGTDFSYQVFVDRMPVNSVLICRVSGLTFTPTNGELYLRATCTGYPESKRIEFEAIEMSSSLSRIYKARYSAPAGTKWSGWKQSLTNVDIDGRLFFSASGTTAIESFDNASNRYRLQVGTAGTVRLYHSSDGGKTWANFKEIAFTS